MDEKLIELVGKCEEFMTCQIRSIVTVSGKKNLWGQIGEGLKKSGKFESFFIAHFEVTVFSGR
jgi:hypothetical protein